MQEPTLNSFCKYFKSILCSQSSNIKTSAIVITSLLSEDGKVKAEFHISSTNRNVSICLHCILVLNCKKKLKL